MSATDHTLELVEGTETLTLSAGAMHTIKLLPLKDELRLLLQSLFYHPQANLPCEVSLSSQKHEVTSDAQGVLTIKVDVLSAEGFIAIGSNTHGFEDEIAVELLDQLPEVASPEGQRLRLQNLGYLTFEDEGADVPSPSAIEEFQCDHQLKVDGDIGAKTQDKLIEVHGG